MEIDRRFDDGDEDGGGKGGGGEGAWLSSYSALMADLMAIFVILISWALLAKGTVPSQDTVNTPVPGFEQGYEAPSGQGTGPVGGISDVLTLAKAATLAAITR